MSEQRTTTFDLWGGRASVTTDGPGDHAVAVTEVVRWLAEVDLAASTWREDSEITALNAAGGLPVRVGPVLAEAIEVALDAALRTDGAVDPTVGAVTIAAPAFDATVTRTGSYRDVVLDRATDGATVRLAPGLRLDLGATAKAWAADRAAAIAAAAVGGGALVSLGGDIATAGSAPEGGWLVVVTDDHREGAATSNPVAQAVSIIGGALATSSTTVRARAGVDGASIAHLVDPATWRPVVPVWRTVSVVAGDCITANTASTAAIVLGERAVAWLEDTGLPCRLVSVDGRLVRLGGWPADDRLAPAEAGAR